MAFHASVHYWPAPLWMPSIVHGHLEKRVSSKTSDYSSSIHLGFLYILLYLCCFANAAAQDTPSVVVYTAKLQPWSDSVQALGTLHANESVILTATVTDTITQINFDDGQRVNKGYVLAEMTDEEESALVQEMSARVAEAKRRYERVQSLPGKGAVSEAVVDEREREYRASQAQLAAMGSRLKDRLIVAPFSGVVGLRNISVGALVEPGDEIAHLTDDSVMKLDFSIPEVHLRSIKLGQEIAARSPAYPEQLFSGEVASIDSRIDPVTRSILVRAHIANDNRLLKPGLLMSILLYYNKRDALVIPEEALIPKGPSNDVLVVSDANQVVEKRSVEIGSRRKGLVEILEGIKPGEQVVTHGTMSARPGQTVNVLAQQQEGEGIRDILLRTETPQ